MANTVKLKQSAVAGKVPTTGQLDLGELAINTNDGKLFLKKNVGGVESIVDVTAGGVGPASASVLGGVKGFTDLTIGGDGSLSMTRANVNNAIGFPSAGGFSPSTWAGTLGYPGYEFNGSGNTRFGLSASNGVLDLYIDGNFYANEGGSLVLHTGNINSNPPAKLSTASGNAPSYSARAWVRFEGPTASTFNGQNISSVSRTAAGQYTISFTTPMAHAGYAITTGTGDISGFGLERVLVDSVSIYACRFSTSKSGDTWEDAYVISGIFMH